MNVNNILGLLEKEPKGVFLLNSYYGVDTCKDIRPLLYSFKSCDFVLVDANTQSYFNDIDTNCDYSICSLRKWFPILDGGFVDSKYDLYIDFIVNDTTLAKQKYKVQTEKWFYLESLKQGIVNNVLKDSYLNKNRLIEKELDNFTSVRYMSEESKKIKGILNENECEKQRIINCKYLYDKLKCISYISFVFEQIPDNYAPLYFPVYVENRVKFLNYLCKNNIYAPILWNKWTNIDKFLNEDTNYIYEHLVALPIDQRYTEDDMNIIVEVIKNFELEYV